MTMKWKHPDSPVKKKSQVQQSVKKVMLIAFGDMKEPIIIDFYQVHSNLEKWLVLVLHLWGGV